MQDFWLVQQRLDAVMQMHYLAFRAYFLKQREQIQHKLLDTWNIYRRKLKAPVRVHCSTLCIILQKYE